MNFKYFKKWVRCLCTYMQMYSRIVSLGQARLEVILKRVLHTPEKGLVNPLHCPKIQPEPSSKVYELGK